MENSRGKKLPDEWFDTVVCHNSNFAPWNRIEFDFFEGGGMPWVSTLAKRRDLFYRRGGS